MKYLLFLLLNTVIITSLNSQSFIDEKFNNSDFPPEGWSISENSENWSFSYTREAKGENLGEAKFGNSPFFDGETKLISPVIDLSGINSLMLQFQHMMYFGYGYSEYIGVSTRSGNSSWHNVWEIQVTDDMGPELQAITINSEDVGSSDFQFCIYFRGKSYHARYWYIDDILLYSPLEKDIKVKKIVGEKYFLPGAVYTPTAVLKNNGSEIQSFPVVCDIYKGTQPILIYSDTMFLNDFNPGEETELEYPATELTDTDEVYSVVVKSLLDGDMDTTNNMKSKYVYTYTLQRQKVALEIGTGVTCGYCPGAAMGADDLVANGEPVAVIEYHYFDHNNDPFSNEAAHIRTDYYGIYGYPTSFFDGILKYVGGDPNESLYEEFLPLVEERKNINTSIHIEFSSACRTTRGYHVTVQITRSAPVLDGEYVLYFVVTESNIAYEWENQDELNYVERAMLPNAEGTAIDLINNNQITLEFDVETEEDWDAENLEVVAFVQNLYDKEIINSFNEPLLTVSTEENIFSHVHAPYIFPNPATDLVNIKMKIDSPDTFIRISVYDMKGKLLAIPVSERQKKGVYTWQWEPGKELPQGVYIIKTTVNDQTYINKVIIH
jgi:hypothetical protein